MWHIRLIPPLLVKRFNFALSILITVFCLIQGGVVHAQSLPFSAPLIDPIVQQLLDSIKPKEPPKPVLTARDNPQHCNEQTQWIASEGDFYCIDKQGSHANIISGNLYNGYDFGYCTYLVATMRYVPSGWGDAISWYGNAQASGYVTGSTPRVGAIAWYNGYAPGHVAFVSVVYGDGTFLITEENVVGWNVVSTRVVSGAGSSWLFIY